MDHEKSHAQWCHAKPPSLMRIKAGALSPSLSKEATTHILHC